WGKASESARAVERMLADARDEQTRTRVASLVQQVTAAAAAAQNDQKLLDKLVEIRSAKAEDREGSATDAAYTAAFRDAGIDVAALPAAEVGAKVKGRPVAVALAAALDDWASVRREQLRDRAGAERLSLAASVADADPWRTRLRTALDATVVQKQLD